MGMGQNKPPGYGPQVLVLSIYQGSIFWVPIFDPQPHRLVNWNPSIRPLLLAGQEGGGEAWAKLCN